MEEERIRTEQNEKIVMQVSRNSALVNILLSAAKCAVGFLAHSGALISDGIHSASDVFSTIVVVIGYKLSAKESDEKHPYGHERMECIAAMILAGILCMTGAVIGLTGLKTIFGGNMEAVEMPGRIALVVAALSIVTKEGMYWYTKLAAKKVKSGVLMADAWHHRSDALSSIGSVIGILGARMGFPIFEPAASIVICVFIVKASYDIFKDAVNKVMDTSCDKQTLEQMKRVIMVQDGVIAIDRIQARTFGPRLYVDVEITADGALSLWDAHGIAEHVHKNVEGSFWEVKHCMVHVNPVEVKVQ